MTEFSDTDNVDLRLQYKIQGGDVLTRTLEDSIKESIDNIIATSRFTRLFNRGFGSSIKTLLFEPMSEYTAYLLKSDLMLVINTLEPRVEFDFKNTQVHSNPDRNRYDIFLSIKILETESTFTFGTFLEREVS